MAQIKQIAEFANGDLTIEKRNSKFLFQNGVGDPVYTANLEKMMQEIEGVNVIRVKDLEDLPAPQDGPQGFGIYLGVPGAYTIYKGNNTPIITPYPLIITSGVIFYDIAFVYVSTGSFLKSVLDATSINHYFQTVSFFGNAGATLFDVSGDINNTNHFFLSENLNCVGWGSLGIITGLYAIQFFESNFVDCSAGLELSNCNICVGFQIAISYSVPINGSWITFKGAFNSIQISQVQSLSLPGDAILNIDPAITIFAGRFNDCSFITTLGGELFKSGIQGVITGFTDSATEPGVKTTVTSPSHGQLDGQTLFIYDSNLVYTGGYAISNVTTNTFDITKVFIVTSTGVWDTSSLNQTDIRFNFNNSPDAPDSTVSAEGILNSTGSIISVMNMPLLEADVIINALGWLGDTQERMLTFNDGGILYYGLEQRTLKADRDINMQVTNSTSSVGIREMYIEPDIDYINPIGTLYNIVIFDNATNTITSVAGYTPIDNDRITFRTLLGNLGALPSELRDDIIYHVVNASGPVFQVAYTSGGSPIAFTDNGSGTNRFRKVQVHGSEHISDVTDNKTQTKSVKTIFQSKSFGETVLTVSVKSALKDVELYGGYFRK